MNESAKQIVTLIGGRENIQSYTHCATRLRFDLKDRSLADTEQIKSVKEVLAVVESGGIYQVVIGPKVDQMYQEVQKVLEAENLMTETVNAQVSEETSEKKTASKKSISFETVKNVVLNYISGAITPNMPVMVASGLISAILAILTQTGILSAESATYTLWAAIADAAFYFLPALIAVSAARKVNASPAMAAFISLALVGTSINGAEGLSMFGLPISQVTYSSNIVPVLLFVPILAIVEKFLDKRLPKAASFVLKPLISTVIVATLTLFVLGPIGTWIGAALANLCVILSDFGGIAFGLAAFFMPFLVITGMHTMLIPVIVNELTTFGYSTVFAANIAVNFAIAGTALAIGVKSKNKEKRSVGLSTGVTALLSVTEPALYGCVIPGKKTLLTACTASGIAGILVGVLKIKGYAAASVSLLTLPVFMGPEASNFIYACIAAAVACLGGFVLAMLFYKEEV